VAFPVLAVQAEPPLVVEVPEVAVDVVGRDVELLELLELLELDELDELPEDDDGAAVDVETAGVGAGGLELQAPSAVRVAATASPMHTRPSPICRISSP